jgi:ribose 5-phosphate isomerase B
MRIAYGADDRNATTDAVVDYLTAQGHQVVEATTDEHWPEIGAAVGRAVVAGDADLGVVLCWTGTGTAIAANKVPGVRAALAWDPWIARGARRWNDANVLAMSLKRLAPDVAVEVLAAFLDTGDADPDEADNIARLTRLESRPDGR